MTTPQAVPSGASAPTEAGSREGKEPRTDRGRRTLRKLLDAAELEFGEKGFHDSSITGITARAGTALGSFYTYFDSKNEIFRALVKDLSDRVRIHAATQLSLTSAIEAEQSALIAFLRFAREHKEIYRIIDEAEFVDPVSYRSHYESTAQRIFERLRRAGDNGEFQGDLHEAHAWAIMGMNVFLGLRFSIWSDTESDEEVAAAARSLLERGILRRDP